MNEFIAGLNSGIAQVILGYPFDTVKTWRQNNIKTPKYTLKNLYRGFYYPLIQNSFIISATLNTNEVIKNNSNNVFLSSFISGIVCGSICCPLEKLKILEQQQIPNKLTIKNILYSYKNLNWCLYREVPASMIYFISYDKFKNNNIPIFISGAVAGLLSWVLTYPIDTIKTRIQAGISNNYIDAVKKGGLFKGILLCSSRAILVNGSGLYIYEIFLDKK